MFGRGWRVMRLLGIPVSVDASWLIILALLTLSFAEGFPQALHAYFPNANQSLAPYEFWIMGLVTALAFFACILLHELGHAVVARARGMPIQGITLFLFGGVAQITEEPGAADTEFFMAIAGPAVTVVLTVLFWGLAILGYNGGWPEPVVLVLGYLALINGLVLVFNLIPAFPLDGGRVLRSILWAITGNVRRATYWASLAGQIFAWVLIAFGVWMLMERDWLNGIWMGLIGLFLNSAAQSSYQQILVREALKGEPVSRFMNRAPIVVPPSIDLRRWVEDYVYHYHHRAFPVASNGRLEGVITTRALGEIPREQWPDLTVGEVMRRDLDNLTIPADADALTALGKMQKTGVSRLIATEGDRVAGMVSLKDLMRFLSLKLELDAGGHARPGPDLADDGRPDATVPAYRQSRNQHHV